MQYERKCPVCGTPLLIEALSDDGNVFAHDSMDCPECGAFLDIEWNPSVSEFKIADEEDRPHEDSRSPGGGAGPRTTYWPMRRS